MLKGTAFVGFALPVTLALTSCSSPERKEPVSLKAGFYEISTIAKAVLETGGSKNSSEKVRRCVSTNDADAFERDPLDGIIPLSGECTNKAGERHGNAFSGRRECSIEGSPAEFSAQYEGSLTETTFTIRGQSRFKRADGDAPPPSFTATFEVQGKRLDDC